MHRHQRQPHHQKDTLGGGLIAGDALAALGLGILGLLATLAS
jgi:hypothetical protein